MKGVDMKTFKAIERLIRTTDVHYAEIYRRAEKHFDVSYKKTDRGSIKARASKGKNWIETEFYNETNCAEYNEYNY